MRRLAGRLRHPQTTVRWRLTLLYGGLFLVCGAALLAITYTLVDHATVSGPRAIVSRAPPPGNVNLSGGAGFALSRPGNVHARQTPAPKGLQRLLRSKSGRATVEFVGANERITDLHHLVVESAIALGIMAVISGVLGWFVAGRVLRPLRTITATTEKISETSLHERLAMPGPRDELRGLADTIDGLLERLEGAFDAQRRFVANASHELRTPLTATRALLEMVLADRDAGVETFRETCRQALEEGDEQERLIDALLALAQGQRGLEAREPIELAAVARDALRMHEPDAASAGVSIDTALEPAPMSGDRRLIERLMSNLVENAIRHNVDDGRVRVTVEPGDGTARLVVANTGPVVPDAEIERLLQPFQRLAPDRVGHRLGLGLGLSIVAAIAAAHAAALEIRPGTGGGLIVELRFPTSPNERAAPSQEPALPVIAGRA